ncbi:response regulator transcription factor [Nocardioides sp. zg-1228]|uniref:response regulator n=1 Tax=Nocardioides sp. zg-1228 TaxID=2763008 RepID=UPI001642A659|nr:response regulator transcription factor [Nocardioides sp. zg-1228]MBC2932826.1 response regulator transcription factor [Nocardioides sp. zg-1228]QSF56959.1 response regulator transcription factor [Nocardioides sp. zg-1228]
MIKVLLVDDQRLLREGLRAILDVADDLTVVAQARNGREALTLGREHSPDVFLMDLQMPTMNGHEAIREIRRDPSLKSAAVLVLTTFDEDDDVVAALAAGADGYLLKDIDAEDLRRAVRRAAAGEADMAPGVLRQMMDRIARLPTRRSREEQLAGLTERDLEILTHVGLGLSNEEIGRALFLSPETARTYVSRLMTKLGARDRAQLVVLAHRAGLVDPTVD